MILEEAQSQLSEIKRLAEYEAKRKRMLEEYNHYITFRADLLLITKIDYKINNVSKFETMRIERNNQPLSLIVHDKFVLKQLGLSEWIEIHALASRVKSKSNDLLLKNLKAKFEWIKTQAGKLGIPSPPELYAFGLSAADKKQKRSSKILKHVFVKEDVVVIGIHRNLFSPLRVEGTRGLVIREPESGIFFYNGNFDLVFQREEEFYLATIAQLIRLQNDIQRGSPETKEMFTKLVLTIKARNDVTEARKSKTSSRKSKITSRHTCQPGWIPAEEQAELKLFFKLGLGGKLNNALRQDKRLFELKPVPCTKLVKE
ncbi:hypothetical protein Tco_0930698 [Tanacetum coccineum]